METYEKCETHSVFSALFKREKVLLPIFSVPSDYKLVCDASSDFIKCAEDFFNTIFFCDNSQSQDKRNLIADSIYAYTNYLCSDDGKRIAGKYFIK